MTISEHYTILAPKLLNWLVATGSSYAQACDIVQEAFLKLFRMRDDIIDDAPAVSGLVFTIARNLRKNEARDFRREVLTDEIPEDAAIANPPKTSPSDTDYLRKNSRILTLRIEKISLTDSLVVESKNRHHDI